IHWSAGKREAKASKKQMTLLRDIHDEVDKKMFDYISVKNTKNLELARKNIMKIKEINEQVNDSLKSYQAVDFIKEDKFFYMKYYNLFKNKTNIKDNLVIFIIK